MVNQEPKRPWEQQLRDAAAHLETDLRNVVKYINDEVVPDVRRNGSEALRAAAAELHKLAQRMDEHAKKTATPPPPPGGCAEAVMYGRIVSVTTLSAIALVVCGCHRETTRAYQPPPPPATNTAANHKSRGAGSTDSATGIPTPTPAPVPESLGKPVSSEIGLASWYGPPYAGRKGADGTVYDQNALTAAHLTLPMGTMVRVTNLTTNQSVVVKITDRGPFVRGRIIDLSLAAAKATGVYRAGVAKVKVEAFAAPVRANANPEGRWCVQIGAFARESDAVKLKEDLLRRYTTAKVIEFPGPTGYWVRVNPKFPDKKNATEVADGIHPKDPAAEPYLIRTD